MVWEAFVCLGSLIFFTYAVEYFTRVKTTPGHPIIPEPSNLIREAE